MNRQERIETALRDALSPAHLAVLDESHLHHGHAGWREGGETHYRLEIVSDAFAGKSRVDRQRTVNALLAEEFASGLHALAMTTKAPGE